MKGVEVRGGILARNTVLNLLGQGLPLLIAVVTVPFVIDGLGDDRFGVLTLAWVVLSYFGIFDLGLGRAATKFVAEALGRGERESVPAVVWTATVVQAVFGVLGGLVLAGLTPLLVERVLSVPAEYTAEASETFLVLAATVPVVLISSSLRGVLAAAQRFDLINLVKAPASSANYLLPLAGLALGWGLPGILALLLASRAATLIAFGTFAARIFPGLRRGIHFRKELLREMLGFGGWVMASNATIPVLTYVERLLIGALLSVGALTYYSVPVEIIGRIAIVPASLALTLFPAFSYLDAGEPGRVGELLARPLKYLLILMTPAALFFGIFASEVLDLWLGAEFAAESTVTLQILSLVFFLNALAHIPFAAVQGLGRPDLKAKLDVVAIPLFLGLGWALIPGWGIAGAAAAKLGVTVLDVVGLYWFAHRIGATPTDAAALRPLAQGLAASAGFAVAAVAVTALSASTAVNVALFALCTVAYLLAVWHLATDATDRKALERLRRRVLDREAARAR